MQCHLCGCENKPEAKFCKQCGAPLQNPVCPTCGQANKSTSRFCKFCGTSLQVQTSKAIRASKPTEATTILDEVTYRPPKPSLSQPKRRKPSWVFVSLLGISGVVMVAFLLGGNLFRGWLSRHERSDALVVNPPIVNTPDSQSQVSPVLEATQPVEPSTATVVNPTIVSTPDSQSPVSPVPGATESAEPSSDDPPASEPLAPSDGDGTACINQATLIGATVTDGKRYPSHTAFTHTWILKNAGTCTWTTNYRMIFQGGDQMEAVASVNLPYETPPGSSAMVSVEMVTPIPSGDYRGSWILEDEGGRAFGQGSQGMDPLMVDITVDQEVMTVPEPSMSEMIFESGLPERGGGVTPSDTDGDGINDGDETWFADTFFPVLIFEQDETATADTIMRFYQVTPIYKTSPNIWNYPDYQFPEYQGPPGVLITYVIAYIWDYGFPWDPGDFGAHRGDAEMMRIFLVNPRDQPYTWQVATVSIKRHLDPPEFYYPSELTWVSNTHPAVWVSQDKHGMYVSGEECNGYDWPNDLGNLIGGGIEQCGGGWVMNWPIGQGVDGFNIGERSSHPFAKIPPSTLNLFTSEFVWTDDSTSIVPVYKDGEFTGEYYDLALDFCGGVDVTVGFMKCGGGMTKKWWPLTDPTDQWFLAFELSQYADKFYAAVYGPQYEICFYTANADKAGTDLHVDATLVGTAHSQTFYNLDNANDNFERGLYDCFYAGSYPLNEKITELSLLVYWDQDDGSEWLLEKATVTDRYSGEFWNFSCNCWLDWKSGFDQTIGANTYGPSVSLQPDLRP